MMTPDAEDRIWYPVEQRPIWARRIRATDTPRNEDQQPAKRLSVYDRYAALQGNS